MTIFDIPNHYDLNTASNYHTDKNTILNDLKTPGTSYGNKMHNEKKIDVRDRFKIPEQQKHNLLVFTEDRLKKLNDQLEERARRKKTTTVELMEEAETQEILDELRAGLNVKSKVATGSPFGDPGAQTLIDWELKKSRLASKRQQLNHVDTRSNYMQGREIREQRQAILGAKLQQGEMNGFARVANQNMETTRKVIGINSLSHVKGKGTRLLMPMNSISFDMGVGNP